MGLRWRWRITYRFIEWCQVSTEVPESHVAAFGVLVHGRHGLVLAGRSVHVRVHDLLDVLAEVVSVLVRVVALAEILTAGLHPGLSGGVGGYGVWVKDARIGRASVGAGEESSVRPSSKTRVGDEGQGVVDGNRVDGCRKEEEGYESHDKARHGLHGVVGWSTVVGLECSKLTAVLEGLRSQYSSW